MKVLVSDKYLEKLSCLKPKGVGKEGKCYLPNNGNKLVKIFDEEYKVEKINFVGLENSQIAFPIDTLYDKNGNLRGYTMYYLVGEKFINGFLEDLKLQDLKQVYLKTRILMLKLKNIYMDDNCLENMLYDYQQNKINLIDTSGWYQELDGEIKSINEFNWQMMSALLKNVNWKQYKFNHDKQLLDLYLTYKYTSFTGIESLFIEFLNELELKVSEYKGEKVKTIKDLII